MLAHLKAKNRELDNNYNGALHQANGISVPNQGNTATSMSTTENQSANETAEKNATQLTCDVLCSLSSSSYNPTSTPSPPDSSELVNDGTSKLTSPAESLNVASITPSSALTESRSKAKSQSASKTCPKQHQLPMFLSKTYHMIDRCDASIATWSAAGDNFVVKNVEKFASNVLPLYFKHSNFSSFARQLNFYGFRKLRTDPILTSDVDPRTASYVRFYHEKFQKDRPELLHQIKRATKSDQQSRDDVDSLKSEVTRLKDCISQMTSDMDRKLAEMSYEYNRRITTLSTEYDKLASLVTQVLARQQQQELQIQTPPASAAAILHHVSTTAPSNPTIPMATSSLGTTNTQIHSEQSQPGHQSSAGRNLLAPQSHGSRGPDLMDSLSQVAAFSLQNQLRPPPPSSSSVEISATGSSGMTASTEAGVKRPASSADLVSVSSRPRVT